MTSAFYAGAEEPKRKRIALGLTNRICFDLKVQTFPEILRLSKHCRMDAAPAEDVITWRVDLYYIAIYRAGAVPSKTPHAVVVFLQTHGSLYNASGRSSNASLSKKLISHP